MIALILAGGSGTRFWPLSTEQLPKQYLTIFEDKCMLKLTYERLLHFLDKDKIFIVTSYEQVPLIYDYLPEINTSQIIAEPCAMNTGACIAYSIAHFLWNYPRNEKVLIVPSDHYISDNNKFKEYVLLAESISNLGNLITFGIQPKYPATGYGYIEKGDKHSDFSFHVKQFKEKPYKSLAETFFKSGNYLWNSGIFCFSIFDIINAFDFYNKEIFEKAVEISCIKDHKIKRERYKTLEKISIDVAIFEKSKNVIVIPVDFEWSDVGNWFALSELMQKDDSNNYFRGKSFSLDAFGNSVFSDKFAALIGVEDIILVETDKEILVVRKDMAEFVKYVYMSYGSSK